MRKAILAAIAAGTMLIGASSANAMTNFTLDVTPNGGKYDAGIFELRNISDTASLTSLTLNFAVSPFNADRVYDFTRLNAGGVQLNWTITPNTTDNAQGLDLITMSFTGFEARNPDEGLRFKIEFDKDSGTSDLDFRNVLFNNGALNNAILTVGFSDGTSYAQTLQDGPLQTSYHYTGVSAVPEPATWAMMIIGFGAVGSVARGSRRKLAMAVA